MNREKYNSDARKFLKSTLSCLNTNGDIDCTQYQAGDFEKLLDQIHMNGTLMNPREVYGNKIEIVDKALELACMKISDSNQIYEEADTAEGWKNLFLTKAKVTTTTTGGEG